MTERLLTKHDVGAMLGVSPKKAAELMKQMRRINISRDPNSQRPRWAVVESEISRWQAGAAQEPETGTAERRRQTRPAKTLYDPALFDENGKIRKRSWKR